MLAGTIRDMGYTSTSGDKDVWVCREVSPDRQKHYSMILVYVDDILVVSMDTRSEAITKLQETIL